MDLLSWCCFKINLLRSVMVGKYIVRRLGDNSTKRLGKLAKINIWTLSGFFFSIKRVKRVTVYTVLLVIAPGYIYYAYEKYEEGHLL